MIKREDYLHKLRQLRDQNIIKVITGMRRSGKSILLKLFREELLESGVDKSQIISLNLEEEENEWLLDRHKLSEYVRKNMVSDKMNYIFLDEIQNVPDFERLVNSFHVKKMPMFISLAPTPFYCQVNWLPCSLGATSKSVFCHFHFKSSLSHLVRRLI